MAPRLNLPHIPLGAFVVGDFVWARNRSSDPFWPVRARSLPGQCAATVPCAPLRADRGLASRFSRPCHLHDPRAGWWTRRTGRRCPRTCAWPSKKTACWSATLAAARSSGCVPSDRLSECCTRVAARGNGLGRRRRRLGARPGGRLVFALATTHAGTACSPPPPRPGPVPRLWLGASRPAAPVCSAEGDAGGACAPAGSTCAGGAPPHRLPSHTHAAARRVCAPSQAQKVEKKLEARFKEAIHEARGAGQHS